MSHATAAHEFLQDAPRAAWHDQTLWMVRTKRDRQAAKVPDWEELREAASQIKGHTLSRLAEYLEELVKKDPRSVPLQKQARRASGELISGGPS